MPPAARPMVTALFSLAVVGVAAMVIMASPPPPDALPPPGRPGVPADAPVRDGDVREAVEIEPSCLPWTEIEPQGPRWPPNELGMVPILVYHEVSDYEARWTRHHDNFRADLERLYDLGYRLVPLSDYVDGTMDIPAGFSPVVITFDDSTSGQFRYLDTPDGLIIDPHSAVGVMVDFHKERPDFGLAATFFVNFPHPFRDQGTWQLKLQTLVELGMDVGNHTWTHADLAQVSIEEAKRQLALPVEAVRRLVPGYEMDILALPFGAQGSDISYLLEGEWDGIHYTNRAILLAGGNPALSPFHASYDPLRIARIQAIDQQFDRWLSYLDSRVYVSDGCPDRVTVPEHRLGSLDDDMVGDREITLYLEEED